MAPKLVQHDTRKLAIAQHAWSATSSGTQDSKRYLSFAVGAQIEIVEEREAGGWWAGRLDGKLGWFPVSFGEAYAVPCSGACFKAVRKL